MVIMETRRERKTKVVTEVLKRLKAQPVQNRIYRIGEKHFRYYHIFDKKEKTKHAFSFYYGIGQRILEDMQRFKDPHILIICDHKNTDLNGEDAVDLLFIPVDVFLASLKDVPFKPSSVEKGEPSWNMNIRVTQDRKYLLDIPGKDNIPLGNYLNRVVNLGVSHEINLKDLTAAGKSSQALKTNNLPTKADCEMAIEALLETGRHGFGKEEIIVWLDSYFSKNNILLKDKWRLITEMNIKIWFK